MKSLLHLFEKVYKGGLCSLKVVSVLKNLKIKIMFHVFPVLHQVIKEFPNVTSSGGGGAVLANPGFTLDV